MKAWADDHPKARLMARKRAQITQAARDAFLRHGFERTSMELVAADAGVSIATLYRHADDKHDLFDAVILGACSYDDARKQADFARLRSRPLRDALIELADSFDAHFLGPENIALLRTVIHEADRFPVLAQAAFHIVETYRDNLVEFLSLHPESTGLADSDRRAAATTFFETLSGPTLLPRLLGLPTPEGTAATTKVNAVQSILNAVT